MNTLEFAKACPEGWQALPEPYREDDVLEFWKHLGVWRCRPKASEISILGNWECFYNPSRECNFWVSAQGYPIR